MDTKLLERGPGLRGAGLGGGAAPEAAVPAASAMSAASPASAERLERGTCWRLSETSSASRFVVLCVIRRSVICMSRLIVRPDTTGMPATAISGAAAAASARLVSAIASSAFLTSSRSGPIRTASIAIVFTVGWVACDQRLPMIRSIR